MSLGFQCKQFYIQHDKCAMKVGTDSLMLGSWVELPNLANKQKPELIDKNNTCEKDVYCLDIGTGSGLLALMLAQRLSPISNLVIDAIEIDENAAEQAKQNVRNSAWEPSINVVQSDVKVWSQRHKHTYDLIVSNPPYFQSDLLSTAHNRNLARHNVSLSLADLFDVATDQLHPRGEFALVLPENILAKCLHIAEVNELKVKRICHVKTTQRKPVKLVLLQFIRQEVFSGECETQELVIHDASGGYSANYMQLTQEFYLNF